MYIKIQDQLSAKSPWVQIKETLIMFSVIIVCTFLINAFVLQLVRVKGTSMLSNYYDGDIVLVEKVSYRFHSPKRGDVVVCMYPENYYKARGVERAPRIKRIIAVGGDTVEFNEGSVYVNGEKLEETYLDENRSLTYGLSGEITIPENKYFVMGDNRAGSVDSRNGLVGCLDKDMIIGRVIMIVVSPERIMNSCGGKEQ